MNNTGPLLRRTALDLIEEALATATCTRCGGAKELRAITDLLRSRLPQHGREDRIAFRNAGRRLAGTRDAEAALEAFDSLGTSEFAEIRDALASRVSHSVDRSVVTASLVAARRRVAAWPVEGITTTSSGPRSRTYRRSRNAMAAALDSGTPELFHEWRKRTKTLWHQARLLGDDSAKKLHKLSTLLGDHHDLAVIDHLLRESPETYASPIHILRLLGIIEERMRSSKSKPPHAAPSCSRGTDRNAPSAPNSPNGEPLCSAAPRHLVPQGDGWVSSGQHDVVILRR